jgi:hypothetical protein
MRDVYVENAGGAGINATSGVIDVDGYVVKGTQRAVQKTEQARMRVRNAYHDGSAA